MKSFFGFFCNFTIQLVGAIQEELTDNRQNIVNKNSIKEIYLNTTILLAEQNFNESDNFFSSIHIIIILIMFCVSFTI